MKTQNKEYEINMFNDIAKNSYYDVFEEDSYKLIIDLINSQKINIKGKILEAGCGTGAFGKRLLSSFKDINIIGVDISPVMVEKAKDEKINYNATLGDLEDKNLFSKEEFDHIFCPFILHHFPDISKVVENFSYWIKKDGYVIIIEPNGDNPVDKFSKFCRKILEFLLGKKFVVKNALTTPNETDHTIKTYDKFFLLNEFKNLFKTSFFLIPDTALNIVGKIKDIMFIILRKLFPKANFSGTVVMLIYKKK